MTFNVPTVAPIRARDKAKEGNVPAWYKLMTAFDPLDLAPGGVGVVRSAGKKVSTAVGKKELDQLFTAFKKNPAWAPADQELVNQIKKAEKSKSAWVQAVEDRWPEIVRMVKKYGIFSP